MNDNKLIKRILTVLIILSVLALASFLIIWAFFSVNCPKSALFDDRKERLFNFYVSRNFCIRYGFTEVPNNPY